jgi:hypothetical protein
VVRKGKNKMKLISSNEQKEECAPCQVYVNFLLRICGSSCQNLNYESEPRIVGPIVVKRDDGNAGSETECKQRWGY